MFSGTMTTRQFTIVFVTLIFSVRAAAPAEGRTVPLLTIGKSFSRNATNHIDDLSKAGGLPIHLTFRNREVKFPP
jgi:hypothetical protein